MTNKSIHPAVVGVIVVILLVAIWFVYTHVMTGQTAGLVGSPGGGSHEISQPLKQAHPKK
jgi:FlaG/FlaF family flagellin (archaellin)